MNFEKHLEEQVIRIMSKWNDTDIYAISFFVTANQLSNYNGVDNFPEFSVGYNTEADCDGADLLSEERWNFAYWSQNNTIIIDANHTEMADELMEWYREQGVVDIGVESEEEMYDEDGNYIGRGPNGYWELLSLVSDIAKRIQSNGNIRQHFGDIPIIIHDLDYSWYTSDMTEKANPNGEAEAFLNYLQKMSH